VSRDQRRQVVENQGDEEIKACHIVNQEMEEVEGKVPNVDDVYIQDASW